MIALFMNPSYRRKVLDCASPLALSVNPRHPKRQRTGAVQDAIAPLRAVHDPNALRCCSGARHLRALSSAGQIALLLLTSALGAAERPVSDAAGIVAAAKAAQPGDVIILRDGVWKDADIRFEAQGTLDAPITLRAQTPGKVILSGQSRLRVAGQYVVVAGLWFKDGHSPSGEVIALRTSSSKHARHCRITNCAITSYNPPDRDTDSKWISLYGTRNRVDRCAFAGKQTAGATVVVWLSDTPNEHLIDHNYFGPRPPLGANGGETIRVGDSDTSMSNSRTVVEHNLFEKCSGEVEIVSNKSCENVYRYNTFLNCQGALTLRHGNRCTVEGNFFLGNNQKNTGGVRIIGEDHLVYNNYFTGLTGTDLRSALSLLNGIPNSPLHGYFQVKRAMVIFNTFVDCRSSWLIGRVSRDPPGGILPPEDCIIANNIVLGKKGPLVQEDSKPVNLRWQANLFYGVALGIARVPGIDEIDPQLKLATDGLWRPGKTSPALARGVTDYPFIQSDIDGQQRGTKPDIGCDQASSAPVQRGPLTADKVGPTWQVAP